MGKIRIFVLFKEVVHRVTTVLLRVSIHAVERTVVDGVRLFSCEKFYFSAFWKTSLCIANGVIIPPTL
jgi:hypothetical protein